MAFSQRGFIPLIVLLVVAIASFVIVKTNPTIVQKITQNFNKSVSPSPLPTTQPENSSSSSPTPISTGKSTKTVTPTPAASKSSTNSSSSSNSSNSSSSSNSSTSTSTPAPTATPTPTPAPTASGTSVTVTSPNGGETYNSGDNVHITWQASGTFNIFIISATDQYGTGYNVGSTSDSNARSMDWIANIGNSAVDMQLTLQIIANKYPNYIGDPAAVQKTDNSNGTFTVKKP